ncbi:hypothetical protein APV28_2617 [Comamonas testosteroni]|nr:hypothetical protein APV28_2617 [Comamonas testosteroni]
MAPIIPKFKPMLVDGRHPEQQSTALKQHGFACPGHSAQRRLRTGF